MNVKPLHQAVLITGVCIATYFGLRALPVESCEFLHYGEFINSEGVIEGCGYEETNFFVMSEIKYPIIAEVQPLGTLEPGKTTPCLLSLTTTTGKPIRWQDVSVSHTERIHAMIVDDSLQDYQHIHPKATDVEGKYQFEFTPKAGGNYSIYLDFIPLTTNRRTLLQANLKVEGEPSPQQLRPSKQFSTDSLDFKLNLKDSKPLAGEELKLEIGVAPKKGQSIQFGPVMGSFAHMVAFDGALSGFAHLHPANPSLDQDPTNPDLTFTVEFDQAGDYQIWAQMVINGEEVFVPFTLRIEQS